MVEGIFQIFSASCACVWMGVYNQVLCLDVEGEVVVMAPHCQASDLLHVALWMAREGFRWQTLYVDLHLARCVLLLCQLNAPQPFLDSMDRSGRPNGKWWSQSAHLPPCHKSCLAAQNKLLALPIAIHNLTETTNSQAKTAPSPLTPTITTTALSAFLCQPSIPFICYSTIVADMPVSILCHVSSQITEYLFRLLWEGFRDQYFTRLCHIKS